MATLETSTRNLVCDYIASLPDNGVGSNGTLDFQTSGHVSVAVCTFANPAFGSAATGTASANTITEDSDADGGTITHVHIKDTDGNSLWQCDVDTDSSEDFQISATTIALHDVVGISSYSITVPA